jgi:hypothetical protein
MLKIEFFDLVFFEQRHYDIDSGITQRPNLVFEPIPAARPRSAFAFWVWTTLPSVRGSDTGRFWSIWNDIA